MSAFAAEGTGARLEMCEQRVQRDDGVHLTSRVLGIHRDVAELMAIVWCWLSLEVCSKERGMRLVPSRHLEHGLPRTSSAIE